MGAEVDGVVLMSGQKMPAQPSPRRLGPCRQANSARGEPIDRDRAVAARTADQSKGTLSQRRVGGHDPGRHDHALRFVRNQNARTAARGLKSGVGAGEACGVRTGDFGPGVALPCLQHDGALAELAGARAGGAEPGAIADILDIEADRARHVIVDEPFVEIAQGQIGLITDGDHGGEADGVILPKNEQRAHEGPALADEPDRPGRADAQRSSGSVKR